MTHGEILDYINFVANKHQEGLILTPEQYATLCNIYNHILFKREFEQAELMARQQSIPMYNQLVNSSLLRPFKKSAVLSGSGGVYTLPSDYVFPYVMRGVYNAKTYGIDLMPEEEYDSAFGRVATFGGDSVKVSSIPTGQVTLEYLSKPIDVYFDWCVIEDTDTVVYLPSGYSVKEEQDEESGDSGLVGLGFYGMYDASNALIQDGVIHVSEEYPHESLSIEFQWEERGIMKIIGLILGSMGVNLKDQFLFEFGQINQQ